MGASQSSQSGASSRCSAAYRFKTIRNNYNTLEQVQDALRSFGLESSQLIVGVDFTKSNEWTGKHCLKGRCLHAPGQGTLANPYESALDIIARTLAPFDDDHLIPCYGFGDATTGNRAVFSFFDSDRPAQGLDELRARYQELVPHVNLAGPTTFAPLIYHSLQVVVSSGMQFHVLLLIADGQVTPTEKQATMQAIEEASHFPLSIVMVGVGDGPWDDMESFDDELPQRQFDNFQFVNYTKMMEQASQRGWSQQKREAEFALWALMELPEQYHAIVRLRLIAPERGILAPRRVALLPPPASRSAAAPPMFSQMPFAGSQRLPPPPAAAVPGDDASSYTFAATPPQV